MRLPYSNDEKKEILSRLKTWENDVIEKVREINPGIQDTEWQFKANVPLDMLPAQERKLFMQKYYDILGIHEILEQAAGGPVSAIGRPAAEQIGRSAEVNGFLSWRKAIGQDGAYSVMNVERDSGDVVSHIFKSLNIQFGTPWGGGGTWQDYFRVGTRSVPSLRTIERSMRVSDTAPGDLLQKGKKFTLFDIETGGLDYGQVRQIDYRSGIIGAGSELTPGFESSVHLRSSQFARGMYASTASEALPAEEFMRRRHGINYTGMKFGDGEEYINKLEGLLQRFQDSDYVIGHNINRFDLDQIFTNLSKTGRYASNEAFRKRIDDLYASLDGKIIDTLDLARNSPLLADIKTAKEFAKRGQTVTHSIENIVLQTNLLQLHPELKDMILNRGLHDAGVDIAVNARIAQALTNGRIRVTSGIRNQAVRQKIVLGGAMTPITNISDPALLTDKTLATLIREGRIEDLRVQPGLRGTLAAAVNGGHREMRAAIDAVRNNPVAVNIQVNALQQEILETRRLGKMASLSRTPTDVSSALYNVGAFDRLTQRNVPYQGTLKKWYSRMRRTGMETPSVARYEQFQRDLLTGGVPYAGLSYEERVLSSGVADISSELLNNPLERHAAHIGSESLVSHFRMYDPASFYYNSPRPTVPIQLLQSAGIIGDDEAIRAADTPIMMRLSPYELNNGQKSVNLGFQFVDDAQLEDFVGHLRSMQVMDDEGIAKAFGYASLDKTPSEVIERFRTHSQKLIDALLDPERMKYGVSVAQVEPGPAGERMYSLITDFLGGKMRDSETTDFAGPLLGARDGHVSVGAFTEMTGIGADESRTLWGEARYAYSYLHDVVKDQIVGNKTLRFTATQIKNAINDKHVDRILAINDFYDKSIRPNFKGVAIGTAAALVGFAMYRHHKENQKYDGTLAPMEFEPQQYYSLKDTIQQRVLSGEGSYSRLIDPLATAPLTANMRNYAIGHTSQSWDKNSALYGGVL